MGLFDDLIVPGSSVGDVLHNAFTFTGNNLTSDQVSAIAAEQYNGMVKAGATDAEARAAADRITQQIDSGYFTPSYSDTFSSLYGVTPGGMGIFLVLILVAFILFELKK